MRVLDMACGEGYGSDVLARRAAGVVGVEANPEAYEHARLRYRRSNLRFARELVETFSEPGRRGGVPADDRAPRGSRRGAGALRLARGGARDGLRLDTQRAHARAEGSIAIGQPLARSRVPRAGVRAAVPRVLRERRDARAVPCAQAARARARAARGLGSRACPPGRYRALLRLVHTRDRAPRTSRCAARRMGELDRALDFLAVCR